MKIKAAMLIGVGVLATLTSPAFAAFPGKNGRIFYSDRTSAHRFSFFSVRPDGSNRRALKVPEDLTAGSPSVSPDGKVVFQAGHVGDYVNGPSIYVMNLDGSNLRRLNKPNQVDGAPSFCGPSRIIWLHGSRLMTVHVDGSHKQRIAYIEDRHSGVGAACSPDGRRIAFTRYVNNGNQYELYVMHADGSHVRRITHSPPFSELSAPNFAPDGRSIVFTEDPGQGRLGIYTIHRDGTELQRVSPRRRPGYVAVYSPNGHRIAFVSNHHAILTIDSDGGDRERVGKAPTSSLDWAPR